MMIEAFATVLLAPFALLTRRALRRHRERWESLCLMEGTVHPVTACLYPSLVTEPAQAVSSGGWAERTVS